MTAVARHRPTAAEKREREVFVGIEQMLQLPPGTLHVTGLDLQDTTLDYKSWQNIGRIIGLTGNWTNWALGDWLLFGENVYGESDAAASTEGTASERYDIAHRVTGKEPKALVNVARVCEGIHRRARRADLPFWVHEPVTRLTPDQQIEWLQRCRDEGWTRETLRAEIRAANAPRQNGHSAPVVVGTVPLAPYERFVEIGMLMIRQAQDAPDGEHVLVPKSSWSQLLAALGEE